MPRLWEETVADHRRAVRDAVVDATWALVREKGLRAVTMSQIAARSGIGRATLYKYFPDVESILHEHHRRMVSEHLAHLQAITARAVEPADALETVMTEYARICYHRARHGEDLLGLLHAGEDVRDATDHLRAIFERLIELAAQTGQARSDVRPTELANYVIHALAAASQAPNETSVERLVKITGDGLRARPAAP